MEVAGPLGTPLGLAPIEEPYLPSLALSILLTPGRPCASRGPQWEGKQEPGDLAPVVASVGFLGPQTVRRTGEADKSFGCFARLCSVVSSRQEACGEAAARQGSCSCRLEGLAP